MKFYDYGFFGKSVEKIEVFIKICFVLLYRGADKSLAQTGKKQATATEDFEFHISYL